MSKVRNVRSNMSDTSVTLGDRVRTIKFDLNSFAVLEDRYGDIQTAMKSLEGGKMTDLRTILWAGLIHDEVNLDPITGEPVSYNITPYQVGGWITPLVMQEVTQKLGVALADTLPEVPANTEAKNG